MDVRTGAGYADLVEAALARGGDRTAFEGPGGTPRLSYRDAAALFARLRAALRGVGVAPGVGAAVLGGNRADAWLAQWAVASAGGRATPLHPLAGLDDHAFVVADAEAAVLVVDPELHGERGRAIADRVPGVRLLTLGPAPYGEDLLALAAAAPDEAVAAPGEPAPPGSPVLLVYTGGTTGRPKGVVLTDRPMVTNLLLQLAEWPWPPEPRLVACAPISHSTGLFVLPTLWRGGTVLLHPRFEVGAFLDAVARDRGSVAFLVPSIVYALLDDPRTRSVDRSALRMLVYGAAPMAPARLAEALEVFGPVFVQLYGQSEAPNIVTTLRPEDHDPARPELLASCGRPSPGLVVALLDGDDAEVADGEVGELCVRGPLVMDGYWRRPEETAAALRGGWLHTGDLAVRDAEGYLTLVGRAKDMIISGGFNVYPAEVEAVLTAHPDVAGAAVVGLPDERWGEAVTAFVVRRPGAELDPAALTALVRERKGPVQAPKAVHVVDALPLTPLGKPDKQALRTAYGG